MGKNGEIRKKKNRRKKGGDKITKGKKDTHEEKVLNGGKK